MSTDPGAPGRLMKAAVLEGFGGPERVVLRDVPRPSPGPGEVLVRVRAAAMNPIDPKLRKGQFRLIHRQRPGSVLGFDLSGEVEELGAGVTAFEKGAAVLGTLPRPGAHAEFALAPAAALLPRPPSLTFDEAAALPAASLSALGALRDLAGLRAGHSVVLNGASGGIGTFAVQLAHAAGAHVVAVGRSANHELLRDLGAHECVDYEREDFARRASTFDVVFDIAPSRSFTSCRGCLAPGGVYVTTIPGPGPFLWGALSAALPPVFGGRRCRWLLLRPRRADLEDLAGRAGRGELRVVVSEAFPLEAIREAHARMESGHVRGKIVVRP